LEDRNRYPNLILLCSEHHTIIDQDPQTWPIEKLYQTKADHELWVETQLTEEEEDSATKLYSNLVNLATEGLFLGSWDWFSDHAIRLLLYKNFVDGVDEFWLQVQKAIWPGKYPELEEAIKNLGDRASTYTRHFMNNAMIRNDDFFMEDKTWSKRYNPKYDIYLERSKDWQNKSTILLHNLVVALNEFADAVRKYLNPNYFFFQGKFIIVDSLGVTNDMVSSIYTPENYIDVE
jgi:hypothetical protein